MDKENFDTEVAEYYDKVIEKGYHDNKKYLSNLLKIIKKGGNCFRAWMWNRKDTFRTVKKRYSQPTKFFGSKSVD